MKPRVFQKLPYQRIGVRECFGWDFIVYRCVVIPMLDMMIVKCGKKYIVRYMYNGREYHGKGINNLIKIL